MTYHCPIHGSQLSCLVSPDLMDRHEQPEPSTLLLIYLEMTLQLQAEFECVVTVSPAFAQEFNITASILEYSHVFLHSHWYSILVSMCSHCYSERWPSLIHEISMMHSSGRWSD
jgi:hypothetical protein